MKRILYIIICTAVWLMCIPGANAQVNDKALTRSGEVGTYNGARADFLTVAGKLSRYPKLSKAGESLKYAPVVTTDSVPAVYITAESARVYGNILFNGWFENVTAKGFELSTNADFPETATVQYPVVSETNQYVECDQPCTQNVFDLVIDQLQSSTTYYVRAFATNAKGTSYGEALTFTTLTAMNVAALPYFTDFSEEGDNENWFLNNGNCTNYWMMGTDLLNQNPALFITTNGETPGYNDLKPVTVMAERLLLMDASDSLTINLDVRMYGESSYDYLKVFLAPKSMLFSAADTNVTPYSEHSYSQYALRFPSGDYSYVTDNDGSRYLHLSCLIDNPLNAGDTAKLVFLWCNDRSTLREPPAIVSSVEVIPLRIKTDSVSDITYNAAAVYSTMTTTLTENLQRGLCYSKYPGVTLGGENCINVVLDQLNGSYSYNLTDLVPNTKYYVRAYALSGNGVISYGDELSFQTEHSTFVVTLPYKTNFSDGYDWLVEHTISTTQNYWNFGRLAGYTDSAMYVTYGDGTQGEYYINATTNISAGRLLRMPQTDSVHVTFYVNCGGEGSYDWMKVLLVPVNEDITTDHYAFDYNTNAMDFSNYLSQTGNQDGPYKLNLTDGTLRIAANLKNPTLQDGDTAKLVFLWHTDGGSGNQPGPIITDLYVSVLDVDVYTDNVSDITDNSAKVNGYVHNPNNEIISKVGVCYGKHINPTFEDNFVESTSINADNTFILPISNLDYNTTYYVRTFMKVDNEVFFGDQIKFMTGMAVIPDELPYVTDFSDWQQWWMNSGDCQNYWKTGKLTDDGDSMLFITNDLLYLDTCGYDITKYTFVTAEKYLKMPDNQNPIELTFDVSIGGESSYDYLMVYLCPMDQSFTPNSTTSVVPVTTNAFDFRHYKNVASGSTDLSRYYFNLTDGNVVHINDLMNNPTPGDTAKLVFLWRTDAGAGTQPGPVISNLSVAEYVTDNVLPYSTNFSSENEEWILYSGASKNYFMTGVPAGTTQSALFVTHDGETCSYNTDWQSFTMAETYFSFPENDSLLLEFDAKAGGEGCCDYLMAFVSQWDVEYNYDNVRNATSDNMGAVPFIGYSSDMSSTNTYFIQLTNGSDLHHFSVKVKNPARNGLGKLVFAWRNDGSGGSAPFDVMVTNVSLTEVEASQATKPTVNTIGVSYYQDGDVYIMECKVVSDGGSALTERGVCCSDNYTEPTLDNSFLVLHYSSAEEGTYNIGLSAEGLTPGATYYFRAYATNGVGTAYGEVMSFTVDAPVVDLMVDNLPYDNGFTDSDRWYFGTNYGNNYWTIGELTGNTTNSLYVTNDDSVATHYDISTPTDAYAVKLLYMPAVDSVYVSFDLEVGGEGYSQGNIYDFLTVALSAIENVSPTNGLIDEQYVSYILDSTYNTTIHVNMKVENPAPEDTAKLIFRWRNDNSAGTQPAAIISNLKVTVTNAVSCPQSFTDYRDHENYVVMQVGNNCWMAQNLRYRDESLPLASDQYSTSLPYIYAPNGDISANNILIEGYLYNWTAAINNASSTSEGMQGLCPEGWHLPTEAEASELVTKLRSDTNFRAQFLKASGYYLSSSSNPRGFGSCDWYWVTYNEGQHNACIPWCTDESSTNAISTNSNRANALSVRCVKNSESGPTVPEVNTIGSYYSTLYGDYVMSCEVVSDGGSALIERGVCYSKTETEPTLDNGGSSFYETTTEVGPYYMALSNVTLGATYYFRAYATNSEGTAYGETKTFYVCGGDLTDTRNNQTYQTMMVDGVCWMKENLRYQGSPAFTNGDHNNVLSYSQDEAYIYYPGGQAGALSTYGYLYNWTAATNEASTTSEGMQGVCPDGWHLPTYDQANAVRDKLSDATFKAAFLDKHAGHVVPNSGYDGFGSYDSFWVAVSGSSTNSSLNISGTTWTVVGNTGKNYGRSIRCVKE